MSRFCACLALVACLMAPASLVAAPLDNVRDPFWPPDYVRPSVPGEQDSETVAKFGQSEWRVAEQRLHDSIKGVSRIPGKNGQAEYLAVINGKVVAVGEQVSLSANGKTYRWKVTRMTVQGGPVFERLLVAAPSAAASKKPEEARSQPGEPTTDQGPLD